MSQDNATPQSTSKAGGLALVHSSHHGTVEGGMPHLEVNFNLWSTLGLVYSITATPLAVGTYLTFAWSMGGSPLYVYGYIFAVTLNIVLSLSLAEQASMYPHTSGQIYWTAKLAPERWSRGLSYCTGVLTSAAWFFWTAGTYLLSAQTLLAMVIALKPSFTEHPWQVFLIHCAVAVICVVSNVVFSRQLPYFLKAMVVVTNCAILFIAVALLVRTHPKQSAKSVFVDVINESGWSSTGVVFFLGLLPGTTSINGFDSAAHMAEEMPDPKRQVPQVMVGNALLSGALGLPMVILYCFCITNPEALLDPVGGMTIIQLLKDSLNSDALFIAAAVFYIFVDVVASISVTTTCSRVWWSFALQTGLPLHRLLSEVSKTRFWTTPANATIAVAFLSCVIGLLQLGPSLVLSAVISSANVCFYASYFIPISCLLWRRQKQQLPRASFSLGGHFGLGVHVISAVWCVFVSVWLLFPYYLPVTSNNMNYSLPVIGVLGVIFVFVWGVRARTVYTLPTEIIFQGQSS